MNEDQKDNLQSESSDTQGKKPLNENELDSVSGGFTIIDTCQKCWNEIICNAFWGQCPHLKFTTTQDNNDLISCDLGHFTDEKYDVASL